MNHFRCSCLLGDAQLSLCGNINKQSLITDDIFNAHLVSFETFANNPSIINDPNLVIRIGGKYVVLLSVYSISIFSIRYYNWNVASALITSTSIFHKQLPVEAIEQLQEKHMTQIKPRTTGGGWWPSFYGKKVPKEVFIVFNIFIFYFIVGYEKWNFESDTT
jgi:phosphatidate phosphatase LPIN